MTISNLSTPISLTHPLFFIKNYYIDDQQKLLIRTLNSLFLIKIFTKYLIENHYNLVEHFELESSFQKKIQQKIEEQKQLQQEYISSQLLFPEINENILNINYLNNNHFNNNHSISLQFLKVLIDFLLDQNLKYIYILKY